MKTAILQHDLETVLGLNDLSQPDREAFLDDLGSLILEKACMRFVADMDEQAAAQFEEKLGQASDGPALLELLQREYPQFETVLEEEIQSFKSEAEQLTTKRS